MTIFKKKNLQNTTNWIYEVYPGLPGLFYCYFLGILDVSPHFFSVAVVLRWTWGFARVVLPLPYNPLFSGAKILAWSHLEGGGVDN